jgi:glucokinase
MTSHRPDERSLPGELHLRAIALDVGGSSVKSAVVVPGGQVLGAVREAPLDGAGSADAILGSLARAITGHLTDAVPAGIGLGFPGPFDYGAGVSWITGVEKFEALYGLYVADGLRQRVGLREVPILFRNDAEAAIVGEAVYGAGRGRQRLIGVTLGTGLGSAFVVAGQPVATGPGVPAQGWLYPVRFRGQPADDCFSRRGLLARLRAAGAPWADVKLAAEAARSGDRAARQIFAAFGADLGSFLDPFAVAFGAEAVLVAGGLARALDLFLANLQQALSVPVLPAQRGSEAALLGAAELVFNQLPHPHHP